MNPATQSDIDAFREFKQVKGILAEIRDSMKKLVEIELARDCRDQELREQFERLQRSQHGEAPR